MPHKDTATRRAYLREYKRRNKEHLKPLNADSDRARNANRRAARYGAPGRVTIEDVRSALAAGACAYCGSTRLLGIDHVVPLHLGGSNDRANLVPCCRACNSSKYRQDRPGRWSRQHDCCQGCGTTERRHSARGLCGRCYQAAKDACVDPVPRAQGINSD